MSEKIIVTNFRALKAKYGDAFTTIQTALRDMAAADLKRGLTTTVADVSSTTVMKKFNGKAVTDPANEKQNKAAVDAIYKSRVPDYILLLGATDVIPHQTLKNDLHSSAADPDATIPADIPYACDTAYSTNPARFVAPTRVVGRLPDIAGGNDPMELTRVIAVAANYQSRSPEDYAAYLGISALVWQQSTALSLQKTFGSNKDLQTSPEQGPKWSAALLQRRSHFINCHGNVATPKFFGQKDQSYPVAHQSSFISGKITEGTVVSAECCYGGQLYNPAQAQGQRAICQTYLASGAYGFFGSTTVAYGPDEGNAQADLLCQYFMQRVLAGASLGRATLEARQQFAGRPSELDPYDLKTLVQFVLIGDPSVHPVAKTSSHIAVVAPKSVEDSAAAQRLIARKDRRRQLIMRGLQIEATQSVAEPLANPAKGAIKNALKKVAAGVELQDADIISFSVEPLQPRSKQLGNPALKTLAKMSAPAAFHVIAKREFIEDSDVIQINGIVAKEVEGKIVSYQKVQSR